MARAQRQQIPERPASRDIKQLTRLVGFLKPYRVRVIFASVALVVAAGSVLAIGQGLRQVIDRGFAAANGALLDQALVALLVVIAVLAAATYSRFYLVSWIGERVTADIRRAVFSHLLKLSPGFFEITRTGEVISRLTNDTTLIEVVVGSSASIVCVTSCC
jgi:ATP-binding cassette subfamily B protein